MYPLDLQEESLKQRVASEFFGDFYYEPLDRIDFSLILNEHKGGLFEIYALWAEAKRGSETNIYESLVQLILTIGANELYRVHNIPEFIGAFDAQKIAFLPYKYAKDFIMRNDFNWKNIVPSDYKSEDFARMQHLTSEILAEHCAIFYYDKDEQSLREFIKNAVAKGKNNPIDIDEKNFDSVYLQWHRIVLPTINLKESAWKYARENLIAVESDFFLADLLSEDNTTINHNLRILLNKRLENNKQKLFYNIKIDKGLFSYNTQDIIFIDDDNTAHAQFWNRYKRPPKEEFWDKIYERRDKLSPEDIRERKGAFFTPQIWVQKAQEYLEYCLGESWQDEYVIWDCVAGTGNLLAGLKNPRNIFASTIDLSDVLIMKELNKSNLHKGANKLNLLENHIFQFDFLNDEFFDKVDSKSGKILAESKLPKSLQEILRDESKRQKLVIFINPPYSTSGNARTPRGTGNNKIAVANDMMIAQKYKEYLGALSDELYTQFFMRIYKEIPNCILGSFSTLKYVSSQSAITFRQTFKAKFLRGFAIPAWTFDNVNGQFPIGFLVWNLGEKVEFKKVKIDIFNENNKKICKKNFYAKLPQNINLWLSKYYDSKNEQLAILMADAPDFQNNNNVAILKQQTKGHKIFASITKYNLIPMCVYFAVRHAIKSSWINDRDQFLHPKNKWRGDSEFHNDCLAFTLFHGQNRISANLPHPKSLPQGEGLSSLSPSLAEGDKGGGYINHFIPFSEVEVGAKEAFKSDFVFRFINGRVKNGTLEDCFIPSEKIAFSLESKAVFESGLKLWRYYHKCAKNSESYLNDASLYDIKEYFQGRSENGKMNAKSADSRYNELITALRIALQTLAQKIEPKIYEYEFLRE